MRHRSKQRVGNIKNAVLHRPDNLFLDAPRFVHIGEIERSCTSDAIGETSNRRLGSNRFLESRSNVFPDIGRRTDAEIGGAVLKERSCLVACQQRMLCRFSADIRTNFPCSHRLPPMRNTVPNAKSHDSRPPAVTTHSTSRSGAVFGNMPYPSVM